MMCYLNAVIIIITFNMMVDCALKTPETIEWGVENHFCGSAIPIIMGLICKLPEIIPRPIEDINQAVRVRRGIFDDCCKAACSPLYMQSYCHEELEKISTDQPIIKYHRHRRSPTIKMPKQKQLQNHNSRNNYKYNP